MIPNTTIQRNDTTLLPELYLAFELSQMEWKLGFTIGLGQAPRLRTMKARDLAGLQQEIKETKTRFGLSPDTKVLTCYEAGRDGFWLHRYLEANGVSNLVVDSASIEVNRRFRRAKTDRLDVGKLLNMLVRYHQGEQKVWSVVHVPSVEVEDQRQMHRELMVLKHEQTRHINRIKGLLSGQGITMDVKKKFLEDLNDVRLWNRAPIAADLRTLLIREYERLHLVRDQIHQIEVRRKELLRTSNDPAIDQVRRLLRLKGIGMSSAWVDVMEFFSWRGFRNRRELGSLAGLTPTPYQSGENSRERGISKAGNRPVRALAIEIAWIWLRNQPSSQLSLWYQSRFGKGSSRMRRIGIVAVARKLLIALWRYLEYGIVPEGAQFKTV
jgi:transposase